MGNVAQGINHKLHPDVIPEFNIVPSFDPLYGFPNGRKEKVMIATEQEMRAAKLPLENRDYCAHVLLKHMECRRKVFPFVYKCHHEKHHYAECQYNEFLDRLKDYEREKRLLMRQKRIKSRAEG